MRRVAVYPGSFDPPTFGHMDIVSRASGLFDELVVGLGVNTDKREFMAAEKRLAALRECAQPLTNVKVEAFDGLLVDFAREHKCQVIVRGLRAVSDFEYEFRVAMANRKLAPEIETMFLVAQDQYSFLASSVVREILKHGGDVSKFVPSPVLSRL